jgi:glycosyltransferase involved in cell wall biosynthesis
MNQKIIAFCGTRGIPANYGGFETAVDEISKRFIARGYQCAVVCRLSHSKKKVEDDQGRKLVYILGSSHRKLETFISSIQTGWHLFRHRSEYGFVFWFNNANFPGILMSLFSRIPFCVNTDGLEWHRKKWRLPFKVYYFLSSVIISLLSPFLISDSRVIQDYYKSKFKKKTIYIPYGLAPDRLIDELSQKRILDDYNLQVGKYFLQVTRFEPENLPLEIALGFKETGLHKDGYKHVVIGFKDNTPYALQLKELSELYGIIMLPATYNQDVLYTLRKNSFCYVHGNTVGGTSPALLEAMSTCPRVLAADNSLSQEVLGDAGYYFSPDNIFTALQDMISAADMTNKLKERIEKRYSWDAVANSYMAIVEKKEPNYPFDKF